MRVVQCSAADCQIFDAVQLAWCHLNGRGKRFLPLNGANYRLRKARHSTGKVIRFSTNYCQEPINDADCQALAAISGSYDDNIFGISRIETAPEIFP
jgi:hypothetical protein